MSDLFRKSALDTMATPEQLDKQVKIVRPATWVIGIILILSLITFILWGFTYQVSNGVNLNGVVFTNNDVINIKAERECIVTDVFVEINDYVEMGDIIAVISNNELLDKISEKRSEISTLDVNSDVYRLLESEIDNLINEYVASTVIKSNCSGYIQSVQSDGSALSAGDEITTIMSDSGYNEIIAYVPLQTAQNLTIGMTAQISPSYAPREEYGYMSGSITEISDTPVTEESIISKMGTLSYTDGILPETACVEVHIKLNLDENSSNGYKWSNSKGENLSVNLGTQCNIIVISSEYHPIELLF